MKKLNKKNHKGITLVEVLVALTIFSLTSLVIAVMVSATVKINIKNNTMNKEMAEQSPIAELSDDNNASPKNIDNLEIKRDIGGETVELPVKVWNVGSNGDIADYKFFTYDE